jgi:hypothetical protein
MLNFSTTQVLIAIAALSLTSLALLRLHLLRHSVALRSASLLRDSAH